MDLDALTKFRATWAVGPLTATKKLERLRSIYKFAVQRKMMRRELCALALVGPKARSRPTLPFIKEAMTQILKAADSDKVDPRASALSSGQCAIRFSIRRQPRSLSGQPKREVDLKEPCSKPRPVSPYPC